MALIVVGGQTKNIGKTTLICNIIVALPRVKWTAVKITNHLHAPRHCEIFKESGGWTIWNQNPTKDESDTAKFLRSGADRALLVQSEDSSLKEACAFLQAELASAAAVIVESASAMEFLDPTVLLLLLDAAQFDFKQSVKRQLERADAFIIRSSDFKASEWVKRNKPVFAASSNRLDPALVSMLEAKLARPV
ncbi:MAG: hypothetical protein DMG64_18155 [Acidobacteria bacterium]|nr:MAG: hypothetical protein DMG64_18155 [Acidobacteriota bacterium]PYY21216.1 MAG: hypothetical protein DMG62_19610 [Acidobacteriota bacterium]